MIFLALEKARLVNQRVHYVAPTYRQARGIFWEPLKEELIRLNWVRGNAFNETRLSAKLKSGSLIELKGADKPDSLRGPGLNRLLLDEAADIKPDAWFKVMRPMLSDTGGDAVFGGTPKGRNWFYHLHRLGETDPAYDSFQFTTLEGGNVAAEEIEEAKRELDQLSFEQEYLASFVNFEGRAYYNFNDSNIRSLRDRYNPQQPLAFCFDFNVAPGVAVVCQEFDEGTAVIGEVYIPRNSNTLAVCDRLLSDWSGHRGQIVCFGDATGGARGSAKVSGSDWELIKERLKPMNPRFDVPPANPAERARLNAVNSRICSVDDTRRFFVDPTCKHLINDLEGVRVLEGGSGEIDKKHDPNLSHISDAVGYYIARKYPIQERKIQTQKIIGI